MASDSDDVFMSACEEVPLPMSSQGFGRGMSGAQSAADGGTDGRATPAAAAAGVPPAATSPTQVQQQPEGSPPTTLDPLDLVLGHLSSPDGNQQQYNTAARGLHRTSSHYQSEARATLRHLDLDAYYRGLVSAFPDPTTRPPAMPWDLLEAFPGVISWTLHQEQLGCFTAATAEQLAAAASKLKRLKVEGCCPGDALARDEQLEGLGRLLWACRQLEEVDIWFVRLESQGVAKPWLLMDPASTSLRTAVAPPLPLRSWESHGIPFECLTKWATQQQQQQLGRTLQRVVMRRAGSELELDSLAALRGLRHLDVKEFNQSCRVHMFSASLCSSMSNITSLEIPCSQEAAELACGLTGLQRLELGVGTELPRLPHGIAALKQLTALELDRCGVEALPPDLGVHLPRLERLAAICSHMSTVPTTLTRLTHLDLRGRRGRRGGGQLTLPSSLVCLQELVMSSADCTSAAGLSHLTALQLLHLVGSGGVEDNLASLRTLSRLRHLDLSGWKWHPAAYGVLAGLQQLTYLHMGICYDVPAAEWALPPQLPALQVLEVEITGPRHLLGDVAALGPWLVQLTALTQLRCKGCSMAEHGELLHLPPQLQSLDWTVPYSPIGVWQLPRGLTRLSALHTLQFVTWGNAPVLPMWLSELRRLEVLKYMTQGEGVEQEVLAHMPALRHVDVIRCGKGPVKDLRKAPHLHFKHGP